MTQAQAENVARAIATALVENGLLDLGVLCEGGEADSQVRPILLGLCENVCEYVHADADLLADLDHGTEA